MLTFLETAQITFTDPYGDKRRKIADAILALPAKSRWIAQARSAMVRALANGVPASQVAAQWRVVDEFEANVLKLDALVRVAWEEARRRGGVVGELPTVTVAEPDKPSGLSGFREVAGITAAVGSAILAIAALASLLPAPFTAGASLGLTAVLAIASIVLGVVAWSLLTPPSSSAVVAASGAVGLVAVAAVAFLFLWGKRK